ncbi:MAG: glutamine synthetase [Pseudomonadota bacterium]
MLPNPSITFAKISDQIRKHNLLEDVCVRLEKEFGLTPCLAAEIEFYLDKDYGESEGSDVNAGKFFLKKEKGLYQYEIDLPPETNMLSLVRNIENSKQDLQNIYPFITFHPKPFPDDYGSAMHFHINFLDQKGENYFDDSRSMNLAASSLCHYLIPTFFLFAPGEDHYSRYSGLMAPTHVSYGPNNRTVAIRIPDALPKRLEHRVSSPLTDPHIAIFAILKSIYLGLKYNTEIKYYDKTYGNAFDPQYTLIPFPSSAEEALQYFSKDFLTEF